MTTTTAVATFINILFAISVWFAVPIILPVAAALGWVLIVCNFLFSFGIAVIITQAYAKDQSDK